MIILTSDWLRATTKENEMPVVVHNWRKRRVFTSKGSYRSWKKNVKVWMMMIKEEICVGHPSLALPPLHLALLALASFALGRLPSPRLP